jgi:hypothetical protein
MADKSAAFVKGGLGCLGAFLVVGLVFVLCGGSMHIDLGGAVLLFVIGGVLGLIVFSIFKKGYEKGRHETGPTDGPDPDSGYHRHEE